jgi:hypothetical protein
METIMTKLERAEAQTKLLVQKGKEQQRDANEPPLPTDRKGGDADQGIVRDERGQEQPRDKERAQRVSRVDKGGDPPGEKA